MRIDTRKIVAWGALVVAFAMVAADVAGQQQGVSLGEFARRERERKRIQTPLNDQLKALGLGDEERVACVRVVSLVRAEEACRGRLGRYVSLELLALGCPSGELKTFTEDLDVRRDPNYEFHLIALADSYELNLIPKRAGLGSLYSEGRKIYFSRNGEATRADRVVYDFAAVAKSLVFTTEDLKPEEGNPGGAVPGDEEDGKLLSFTRPEESCAAARVISIGELEGLCQSTRKTRFCSLDQLFELDPTEPVPADKDPRRDPNYEYKLVERAGGFEISAEPRIKGVGWFYCDTKHNCFYNPRGRSTDRDRPISPDAKSHVSCSANSAASHE